tara:strand:+ start:335 stop:1624 length:1290 start_codon:yes stop_codon:yes gene_type:complete
MINKYYNLGKNILFPINRSITGKGIIKTLKILKKTHPKLKIKYFKSGKKVFDWIIPSEWNVKNAYVLDQEGKKIIDFKKNNLHLMGYSMPVNKKVSKKELLEKLFSSQKVKNAIPYVTSYYKKNWGFCVSKNHKNEINKKYKKDERFKILIDSNFKKNGNMPIGEYVIQGESKQEILISTYVCHPSMANNELSGPLLSMMLIDYFKKYKLNKTLRFIFVPETIGSIAYIHQNKKKMKNIIAAFNLTCVGDQRSFSCMLSKSENAPSDHALISTFKKLKIKFKKFHFTKRGSDERQFNWPGIDIPMTSFFRTKYGEYPEYHTSEDTFGRVVTKKGLMGSFKIMKYSIESIMKSYYPIATVFCEPKMDKRGLYSYLSFTEKKFNYQRKYIDFMIYSDGKNNIDQIAKKIKLNYKISFKIFKLLLNKKLIRV